MTKEQLKAQVIANIDANKERIIAIGEQIFVNPELGFKELKTSKLVKDTLDELCIPHEDNLAITGVKGNLK